jgi:hypothetical protein
MANQSKLKAWVRYDGTGRVISGGPIFQVNKPKVGNWKQINANLCCNGNPSSTTTTTTSGGGGVTPTAFIKSYWLTGRDSCDTTTQGSGVFYSASTELVQGSSLFIDAALTIPATQGWVIPASQFNTDKYLIGFNGVLSLITCPISSLIDGTYLVGSNPTFTCEGIGTTMTVSVPDTGLATAAYVLGDFGAFGFAPGSSISIRYNVGGINYIRQFSISFTIPSIANAINGSRAC